MSFIPPSPSVTPTVPVDTTLLGDVTLSTFAAADNSAHDLQAEKQSVKPYVCASGSHQSYDHKEKRKVKRNASANIARAKRRDNAKQALAYHIHSEKATKQCKPKHMPTISIHSNISIHSLPVSSTGFVALEPKSTSRRRCRRYSKKTVKPQKVHTLAELVGPQSKYNFKLVKHSSHHQTAIVDSEDRVIAVIANHPHNKDWDQVHKDAAEALEARRHEVTQKQTIHRHGAFKALSCGVSHGGGQEQPGNLINEGDSEKGNVKVLEELNGMSAFKRLAGFATSVMHTWAPALFNFYSVTLDKLHHHHSELIRIFPQSIFSAVTYNFGPRTICYKHKDLANLAFGWCAITALGSFDFTKGGHLVLWELGLVIEFPPGCTILIPSALLTHSNIPVSPDEHRYSFAQYTAGGIFRWVSNDFKTQVEYLSQLSPEGIAVDKDQNANRWNFGLSLFSTWEKLQESGTVCK